MTDKLWQQWQDDWRRMEAIALKRGWELRPLKIAPSASEATIRLVEARHGLKFPPQLRELLTQYSAHVAFGWHIPSHLHPLGRDVPTMSTLLDTIWNLAHIDQNAIPSFLNWKRDLADKDISEAPNRPEMWENQFPFYGLVNGDVLTIDMSQSGGPQPIRYFSHDLEMLHGLALAPDLFTFITEMSKLGFAGTEWASWLRFGRGVEGDTYYLSASTEGGKAWRAWLERDPHEVEPDEPPPAIVETTVADRGLLTSARANNLVGVNAALAARAKIDAVWNQHWLLDTGNWDEKFCTAVTYATRHNNIAMLEALLDRAATLNIRRLSLDDAVQYSALKTVKWLVAHGARVNGWKDQRHWPLHLLVTRRGQHAAQTREEYERYLREEDWPREPAEIEAMVAQHIDGPTYDAMLSALLEAGADPDARWDNGITMLMWGGVVTAKRLLQHGADIHARDDHGWTVLHRARTAEKLRLLVAHGADVNVRATPRPDDEQGLPHTPLQAKLLTAGLDGLSIPQTLLELGADPRVRDGKNRSTLCYCTTIESFRLIAPYGLDPMERMPDGGTLLHNLLKMTSVRATVPREVAFFQFLLGLGFDINTTDHAGQTMLHIAAERTDTPADVKLLLDHGADKSIKDNAGQRPIDLMPKSLTEVRALLQPP